MKLRPYHNPQRADESLVPAGWRLLYADEFPLPPKHKIPCRLFVKPLLPEWGPKRFGVRETRTGRFPLITYIIPVNAWVSTPTRHVVV